MENTFGGNDNKTYVLAPLTLGDNKKFVKWARYRRWEQFQSMKGTIPQEVFDRESGRLLEECNCKDLNESSPEVTTLEKTLEGIAYWVYLSLKHTYPALTLDTVEELITPNNLLDVYKRLMILSGIITKKNEEATPEKTEEGLTTEHSTEKVLN